MANKNVLLSARQASRVLRCPEQKIRERMKRGIWNIGQVVPPAKKGGPYQYEINAVKLAELAGLDIEEVRQRAYSDGGN